MKKLLRIFILILIVLLVVWYFRSDRSTPDGKLGNHFKKLCDIAGSNIKTPERGVDKTFHYLAEHSPEMLHLFGETLVAIESISDDAEHDNRARKAARRIRTPLIACEETFARFGEAVSENPKARAKLERGVDRFGRTLEILLGAEGRATFDQWLELQPRLTD